MVSFNSKFADRGKDAEKKVHEALTAWAGDIASREFNRLIDTRAAGRIVKAAAADFEFFSAGAHGLIEAKETEHEFRLQRSKITQIPRLRKRAMAGGVCLVLVYHSTLKLWRAVSVDYLMEGGDKGSWDLRNVETHTSAGAALASLHEVFSDLLDKPDRLLYCHYCRTRKPSEGFKVITHLLSGTKRLQCSGCNEVRKSPEAMVAKVKADSVTRANEQATRSLLAKEAKTTKRKANP